MNKEEEIKFKKKIKEEIISRKDELIDAAKRNAAIISEFIKGAEWQKQQMMKNTVLETKVMMDCDGDGIETPYEEWLTLENTEILSLPDNIGLKDGDKVKIIIIKED